MFLTQCQPGSCDVLIASWGIILIIPVTVAFIWYGIRKDNRR